MTHQSSDSPILGTPTSPDLLNRERFAQQIAGAITSVPRDSGFVLSLEGPWGCGKTSLLNLIVKKFEKPSAQNERPVVCWFNPWIVGNAETLVQSFLVQLAASIGFTDHAKNGTKAAKELLTYSSIFTALKFIPGAEPWATMVKDVLDTMGTATDKISDLKKLDIEKRKTAVTNALKNIGRRIVVLVDDLDRLPPVDVFSMVRLVKAVGDFPGVVYVLCYDPLYIQHALEYHHIRGAQDYLDKVVQARLTVPIISQNDLAKILDAEFETLPSEAKEDFFPDSQQRFSEVYFGGLRDLLETPRDIKRLFNRIRFVEPGCRGEVNLADLLSLEAIALKAPAVYQHIRDCPAAYIGHESGMLALRSSTGVVESYAEARNRVISTVVPRLQSAVKQVLANLFPAIEDVHFGGSLQFSQTRGLLYSADRLAIALLAGLPTGEVPYSSAVELLRNPRIRSATIDEVTTSGYLGRFIEHLRFAEKEAEAMDVLDIARALGRAFDSPEGVLAERESHSRFSSSIGRNIWSVLNSVLAKTTPQERQTILNGIITDPTLLSVGAFALAQLQLQHGAYSDERTWPEKNRWIDSKALETLTNKWSRMVREKIKSREVFRAACAGMIFYNLKRFRPDVLSKIIGRLLNTDMSFDQFITAIAQRGISSGKGKYLEIRESHLEGFGDTKKIKERAKQRLKDSAVTGEIRHAMNAVVTGRGVYLSDGTPV